ncbi:MAG: PhnD/SsuA/transferrin family substrate-binding protein [Pseudomonadota bacterium]
MVEVSLPMYALPGTAAHWSVLWRHVRSMLRAERIDAPARLSRPEDLDAHWRRRDLLLSQTCAMPYRLGLHKRLALVGAFDFGLFDCPPGYYRSALVVRQNEKSPLRILLDHGRHAINAADSQSGCWALRQFGVTGPAGIVSGSHAMSLHAVRSGVADFAAIDLQSWRLLRQLPDHISGLRIAAYSRPTPGLPLVTARPDAVPALRQALGRAIATCPVSTRLRLGLRGIVDLPQRDYLDPSLT